MVLDPRRYFDEIELGEEYESPGRTVTEADIVGFQTDRVPPREA